MNWLLNIAVGILTGLAWLFGGGFVANSCVKWYRISSFEGGSGYFIVVISLISGVLGLIAGIVVACALRSGPNPSFLKALGAAWGITLALTMMALAVCWWLADIPPRIDGRPLLLEVELRLPKGAGSPAGGGESFLKLHSLAGQTSRGSETGELRPGEARLENERWIVPGEVAVFTQRGSRLLQIQLNGEEVQGALVPLPARPGKPFLEWSEWLPRSPWPDTKYSYRFRVQLIMPPPPGPTPEEITTQRNADELAAVGALDLDAPITDWLPYLGPGANEAIRTAAIERIRSRSGFRDELSELLVSEETGRATVFLRLVEHLPPDAGLVGDVAAAGSDLAGRIKKVNATPPEEDPHYDGAADVSSRFNAWMAAARALRSNGGDDFTDELAAILELSRVRTDSRAMQQDVCRVASFYLQEWAGIAPLPTDPKPR